MQEQQARAMGAHREAIVGGASPWSGERLWILLAGAIAFLLPLGVYMRTLSPTLNFWDCGEFITTSYILGIPHPPATPLYVIIGRLAGLLPVGLGVAHRINMMSALFASLATLTMFLLVLKVTKSWNSQSSSLPYGIRILGGLIAALFIAFSDTFWTNAVEAEVYSMGAFFMGLVVWLVLDWCEHARYPRGNALVYLILYLLSLGVGLHLGSILVFPGFFVLALLLKQKSFSDLELWLVGLALALFLGSAILHMPDAVMLVGLLLILAAGYQLMRKGKPFVLASLALFILGLSVHLFLIIRAGQDPVINEADPSTWKSLWAVLKREQYPFQLPTTRKAPLSWQFAHFFEYFGQQFRMPPDQYWSRLHLGRALTALPIGLGLLGLWYQWKRERRHWAALATILLVNTIGLIFFLNFSSEEVRERDYFYAAGFYFYSLFIGLGAVGLLESLVSETKGKVLAGGVGALILLSTMGPLAHQWYRHDRSENLIARDYAYNMLAPLEPNSVLFTNGDNDTFPLWYIQEVEGFRKDVRVVNLSLLNTDWYMRQLRDYEPVLPVAYTDAQIDEVATHWYRLEDGSIMQPRDEVINHMFLNTQRGAGGWESRPFYFAVTIPRETLRPFWPYLAMEGMVYRMTLTEGPDRTNIEKLRENLEYNFEWRGLLTHGSSREEARSGLDPASLEQIGGETGGETDTATLAGDSIRSVLDLVPVPEDSTLDLPGFYKDETITHLIQNYAAAWSRYAVELDRYGQGKEDTRRAARSMEMARYIREDLRPVMLYLGYFYMKSGEAERAMAIYEHYLRDDPPDHLLWAYYARACEAAEQHDKVVKALTRVIELDPNYEPAYISLVDYMVAYFPTEQNLQTLRRELQQYLSRNPDSPPIRERLRLLEEAISQPGSLEPAIPGAEGDAPAEATPDPAESNR